MFNSDETSSLIKAQSLVVSKLLQNRDHNVRFTGYLASSAVSTAVASMALSLCTEDQNRLKLAINWLVKNINKDGGWGDTTKSPSNLSAVLLSRAAIINSRLSSSCIVTALQSSKEWLEKKLKVNEVRNPIQSVLEYYGTDLTFSVPILTVCMLSNAFGENEALWKQIPSLPYEFSLLPQELFRFMRLPVVSYAIPALIAVGIAQATNSPSSNPVIKWIREKSTKPALRKLVTLIPNSGGFLEAAPLTGFVSFCLGKSGYKDSKVVKQGLSFLRNTMREDGSWPIDTNLSSWLTSLSVNSLIKANAISTDDKKRYSSYLKSVQSKEHNIFTNSKPGGWAWTELSGGIPDGDDTAAALITLARLEVGSADENVTAGLEWLLELMNNDGGIPTFCRGWGFLPFDRSCPDLSAHALMAFQLWNDRVSRDLQIRLQKATGQILGYLESTADSEKMFSPLWFGDQEAPKLSNRVYGTSVVLEALSLFPIKQVRHLINPALNKLYKWQNSDGGFGGEQKTTSKIETTAKAALAMILNEGETEPIRKAIQYLKEQVLASNGNLQASPIGLYFSSLWYDEKLYPIIFTLRAFSAAINKLTDENVK